MNEKPIIFNTEMITAILDGRKTVTRRPIEPQPCWTGRGNQIFLNWNFPKDYEPAVLTPSVNQIIPFCSFGKVGDHLWVKENWRVYSWHHGEPINVEYEFGKYVHECIDCDDEDWDERISMQCSDDCKKAGLDIEDGLYQFEPEDNPCRWRPSIHMPRWASRITLEITDIRVERLQGISEENAQKEGYPFKDCSYNPTIEILPTYWFFDLWDSIYGDKYSVSSNPWVWVIEFKAIEK